MPIETDPLSLVFIGCFLFGFLFLVIVALLGQLSHGSGFHHLAGGHALQHIHAPAPHGATQSQGTQNAGQFSFFTYANPTSIALFLLGFGFFGYVLHTITSFILPIILLLAVIAGGIIALVILSLLSRAFTDSEANTEQDVSDRVGLLGKVSLTIQPGNMGEVIYVSPGGMRKSIPARSVDGQRLERGEEVVVVAYQNGVADVDTWNHFIHTTENTSLEPPDIDALEKLRALVEETNTSHSESTVQQDVPKE